MDVHRENLRGNFINITLSISVILKYAVYVVCTQISRKHDLHNKLAIHSLVFIIFLYSAASKEPG
jgi:hypothetical protein